jgi:hypothetical protein
MQVTRIKSSDKEDAQQLQLHQFSWGYALQNHLFWWI